MYGDGGAQSERVWIYPVVSVLDRARHGQEIAA